MSDISDEVQIELDKARQKNIIKYEQYEAFLDYLNQVEAVSFTREYLGGLEEAKRTLPAAANIKVPEFNEANRIIFHGFVVLLMVNVALMKDAPKLEEWGTTTRELSIVMLAHHQTYFSLDDAQSIATMQTFVLDNMENDPIGSNSIFADIGSRLLPNDWGDINEDAIFEILWRAFSSTSMSLLGYLDLAFKGSFTKENVNKLQDEMPKRPDFLKNIFGEKNLDKEMENKSSEELQKFKNKLN
ncbi:MAG TPA: hypothetical protein EYO89_04610 [Candidatus Dadabacteria bacterium]|nr:hypothetical protein [Candidatus Dadabacteria bacterium]